MAHSLRGTPSEGDGIKKRRRKEAVRRSFIPSVIRCFLLRHFAVPSTRRLSANLIKKEPHLISFIHVSGQNYSLSSRRRWLRRGNREGGEGGGLQEWRPFDGDRCPTCTCPTHTHSLFSRFYVNVVWFELKWVFPARSTYCPCASKGRKRVIKFAWSHLWQTVEDRCSFALGEFCWSVRKKRFKKKRRKESSFLFARLRWICCQLKLTT